MKSQTWMKYLLAYGMWALVLLLAFWLLLLGHQALLGGLATSCVDDSMSCTWQARALEKFFFLGVGLLWIVVMITSEFYFRRGVQKGTLFERFGRVFGIELLLLFLVDGFLFWIQGLPVRVWLRWLMLAGELGGAVFFLWGSRRAGKRRARGENV